MKFSTFDTAARTILAKNQYFILLTSIAYFENTYWKGSKYGLCVGFPVSTTSMGGAWLTAGGAKQSPAFFSILFSHTCTHDGDVSTHGKLCRRWTVLFRKHPSS
jgi:hypothetical protein